MPGYLVYLPNPPAMERDALLRSVGLDCLTGDNRHTLEWKDVHEQTAPDGKGGLLFRMCDVHDASKSPPMQFMADAQEWTQARPDPSRGLSAGRYWLGRMKDQSIRPRDLQRPAMYDGTPVKLLDGHDWQMPIARRLPQNLELDEAGEWAKRVKPAMADYFDRSEQLFNVMLELAPYNLPVAAEFVVRGLGMNYYVNRDIVSWLGLLDETHTMEMVAGALEWEQIEAVRAAFVARETQKKTPRSEPLPSESSTALGCSS